MSELFLTKKMTKSSQVFITLRDQILIGQLAPGTHLTLRPIAKSLGVSVGSVSEAIRQLSHEGLVEMEPHYGAHVKRFDAESVRGWHILRIAVECEAIRRCADHMSQRQIAALRDQAEALDRLIDAGENLDVAREKDFQFHMALCESSGVETLQKAFHSTHPRRLLAIDSVDSDETFEIPIRAHVELVEAIESGDPNISEKAMREHCERSMMLQLHGEFGV